MARTEKDATPVPVYAPLPRKAPDPLELRSIETKQKVGNVICRTVVKDHLHSHEPQLVCSVYQVIEINRQHPQAGTFILPPFDPENEERLPYSYVWVYPTHTVDEKGEGGKRVDYDIEARDVAQDLFGRADIVDRGVFIPAEGNRPTMAEIAAATKRFHAFLERAIQIGDGEFTRRRNSRDVDINAMAGCRILGVHREWAIRAKESCPGCGEQVTPGVAKCFKCGAILNREKAIALGLVPASVPAPAVA